MNRLSAAQFFLALVCLAPLAHAELSGFPDPDHDGDGVSDYLDYCPNTPSDSASVWKQSDFESGKAQLIWVGCAGGLDSNKSGYTPPTRPENPSMFFQVDALLTMAVAPQLLPENFEKVIHIGRCYLEKEPNKALQIAFLVHRSTIIDGPLGGSALYFRGTLNRDLPANELDLKSFAEVEEHILSTNVDLERLAARPSGLLYAVGRSAKNDIVIGQSGTTSC